MSRLATPRWRLRVGGHLHLSLVRSVAKVSLEDPRLLTGLTHYLALLASLVILGIQGPPRGPEIVGWLVIFVGVSGLRVITAGRRLSVSTVALDALAMVVFLVGTGAPASPFLLLALAGGWWAGRLEQKGSGLRYAAVFGIAYLAVGVRDALAHNTVSILVEQIVSVAAIATLSDWFHGVDRDAIALSSALKAVPHGMEQLAVRQHLQTMLGASDVPVDVVLTAAQVGLTVAQTELLGYLVLGLSSNEIADAAAISEATVRYRLTRLYRALQVRGRKAAVARAHELGLAAWVHGRLHAARP